MTANTTDTGRRGGADRGRTGLLLLTSVILAGCEGQQSALAPSGEDARVLGNLFWVMLGGAVILWLLVNGLFFYVTRINRAALSRRFANGLIVGGGVIFPTIVLGGLLTYGLSIMPDQRAPGDGLTLRVTGEQWWWRVEYWPEGAETPIVAANEIRLPAGERSEIRLDSARVIHSFWIPSLGGKMDMFPGRETRMSLKPEVAGRWRGQCAEFCGASHALMAFEVVAMPPDDFNAWLQAQAAPATSPTTDAARRGARIFAREGCGACHAVRGTGARGAVGPDLTHVGSRLSLGAGTLTTTLADFERWIAHTGAIKPEVEMPGYGHLGAAELADLAQYLKGLE
ncbi:cytochrome c oxidase subunit II [Oceaniglobus indicus]|uniref:cytochrome c oxidase subunit II n=1 Tax=Oceaniglobus indicus TaxID=2047749 RepID=UPI000C1992D1|nr:cytochrome c oxidase subunit II [Oceaniglobus indicus]